METKKVLRELKGHDEDSKNIIVNAALKGETTLYAMHPITGDAMPVPVDVILMLKNGGDISLNQFMERISH